VFLVIGHCAYLLAMRPGTFDVLLALARDIVLLVLIQAFVFWYYAAYSQLRKTVSPRRRIVAQQK
jgi:hypothetical protein